MVQKNISSPNKVIGVEGLKSQNFKGKCTAKLEFERMRLVRIQKTNQETCGEVWFFMEHPTNYQHLNNVLDFLLFIVTIFL